MKKSKLHEILSRMRDHAAGTSQEAISDILDDFENEIEDDEEDTGGSNPPGNKERPDKP